MYTAQNQSSSLKKDGIDCDGRGDSEDPAPHAALFNDLVSSGHKLRLRFKGTLALLTMMSMHILADPTAFGVLLIRRRPSGMPVSLQSLEHGSFGDATNPLNVFEEKY